MAVAAVTTIFTDATPALSAAVNDDFDDLVVFANDQTLHLDGGKVPTAALSLGGFKVTNLGTPVAAGDMITLGAVTLAPTLVDAKGDLLVATAADVLSRLAVGTDAQVLSPVSTSLLTTDLTVGADDGYVSSISFTATATDVYMGNSGGYVNGFFRFPNITIPQGTVIVSAVLTLVAVASNVPATCFNKIKANDVDNAVAPTTKAEADALVRTTAGVDWDPGATWTAGVAYALPNCAAVVQEIIDRPGWVSGNALQIIVDDDTSTLNSRVTAASVEHATYAAPHLVITYAHLTGVEWETYVPVTKTPVVDYLVADQTWNGTVGVYQTINDISLAVAAGEKWYVQVLLYFDATIGLNRNIKAVMPAGTGWLWWHNGTSITSIQSVPTTAYLVYSLAAATLIVQRYYLSFTAAGNLTFQMSNTGGAQTFVMKAGTHIIAQKLN